MSRRRCELGGLGLSLLVLLGGGFSAGFASAQRLCLGIALSLSLLSLGFDFITLVFDDFVCKMLARERRNVLTMW